MRTQKILIFAVLAFCAQQLFAGSWKMNPHTGKLDYYEAGVDSPVFSGFTSKTNLKLSRVSTKFSNNSTYTAAHIRSLVDPHPAPGNNRNIAYNSSGSWAGASFFNVSSGRVGLGTSSPTATFSIKDTAGTASDFFIDIYETVTGQLRHRMTKLGAPVWYLNDGSTGEVGRISYSTPASKPGIVFFTRGDKARFNFANYSLHHMANYNSNTVGGLSISRSGKVGINVSPRVTDTTQPTSMLHVIGLPAYGGANMLTARNSAVSAGHTIGAFFLYSTAGSRTVSAVW